MSVLLLSLRPGNCKKLLRAAGAQAARAHRSYDGGHAVTNRGHGEANRGHNCGGGEGLKVHDLAVLGVQAQAHVERWEGGQARPVGNVLEAPVAPEASPKTTQNQPRIAMTSSIYNPPFVLWALWPCRVWGRHVLPAADAHTPRGKCSEEPLAPHDPGAAGGWLASKGLLPALLLFDCHPIDVDSFLCRGSRHPQRYPELDKELQKSSNFPRTRGGKSTSQRKEVPAGPAGQIGQDLSKERSPLPRTPIGCTEMRAKHGAV